MRFVAVFFAFCAVAFSQSAPDNNLSQAGKLELLDKLNPPPQDLLKNRVESMRLFTAPRVLTPQAVVITGQPTTCAIPLLNATSSWQKQSGLQDSDRKAGGY